MTENKSRYYAQVKQEFYNNNGQKHETILFLAASRSQRSDAALFNNSKFSRFQYRIQNIVNAKLPVGNRSVGFDSGYGKPGHSERKTT